MERKDFSQKVFYDQFNGYNKYTKKWGGFETNQITFAHELKQLPAMLELINFTIQNVAYYSQLSIQQTLSGKY